LQKNIRKIPYSNLEPCKKISEKILYSNLEPNFFSKSWYFVKKTLSLSKLFKMRSFDKVLQKQLNIKQI